MSCKCDDLNKRCFESTGCINVEELLTQLENLAEDFLLDERDDDNYTIPLIQQIHSRLDLVEDLEEENEKIKKQYNCYACGNCGGKEDYVNLEKHHLGLRKEFDRLVRESQV